MEKVLAQKVRIHNRFDIEVLDTRTGEIRQRAQAENIVLDQLYTKLMENLTSWAGAPLRAYFTQIHFGTGAGTLAASRTALFTPLGYKPVVYASQADVVTARGADYVSRRKYIILAPEEYVGAVLSEVGIGDANTLTTHALLKDMNGNSVTIEKTATDVLTIYATIYLQFDTSGWDSGHMNFDFSTPLSYNSQGLLNIFLGSGFLVGSATEYANMMFSAAKSIRCVGMYSFDAYGERMTGEMYLYTVAATVTASAANKRYTFYARLPYDKHNDYPIQMVGIAHSGANSYRTNAAHPLLLLFPNTYMDGTSIVGESIGTGDGTETDFTTAYPFVRSGAVVKVDGTVVSSGVTVHTGKPKTKYVAPNVLVLENPTQADALSYSMGPGHYVGSLITLLSPLIFENPLYATVGIKEVRVGDRGRLYSSTDMVTWDLEYTSTNSATLQTIDADRRGRRYWKVLGRESDDTVYSRLELENSDYDGFKNVVFDTPPATGAVITMDYTTDVIAKDANHVLDVTIQFDFSQGTE